MALTSGTRLGPYEILAPLGAGGMGEVYRARDTRLGREVAVKVLPAAFATDPDRLRRFEQEARAAGALNHPNILVLHDVGVHEGTPYLVTELLEGETLRDRLEHGALSPRKAIDVALQIARGLAGAHDRGLVHRDLKPANLFILRDGRVKILDFGLAKLTRPEPAESPSATRGTATVDTDKSVVMGTAGYMAPEQVRGQPADHRADIFAFGAILYEMLSGRRAFQGETSAETMTAILREEPPEMARDGRPLPPALDRIVRHCLEKSSHERFQSASDIAFALEALSGMSDSGPKEAVARARGTFWRRFMMPALVALALVLAGALLGRSLEPRSSGKPIRFQSVTFRRGAVHHARFSADGNSVYYSASWSGDPPRIYSCHPGTPGELIVAAPPQSFFLAVSLSNELAILVRYSQRPHGMGIGTLARMSPGGSAREVLDSVTEADWSPDGSRLAVIHVVGNRYRVEYPIGTVLHESTGWISHLRIAPDGKRVAFLDHPSFPDDRGTVMIATGPGRTRVLTPVYSSAQGLAWVPNGRAIWYCGALTGASRTVFAVSPTTARVRVVTTLPNLARVLDFSSNGQALLAVDNITTGIQGRGPGEEKERDLTWLDWSLALALSPDGKTLLFDEEGEGAGDRYSTCIRGTDGSAPIRLGEGAAGDLSPDGKWVLAIRYWTNPPELVLFPTGPGEPRDLPPTGLEHIFAVRFFPSGHDILITGNEKGYAIRSYVFPLAGGALRALTPEGIAAPPDPISPDGKWVIGAIRGGAASLYPVDGGSPRPIQGKQPSEALMGWSRDGKSVFVAATVERGARQVVKLNLATGSRQPWIVVRGPEDPVAIMSNRILLARDDHSYAYVYSRVLSALYLVRGLR
jgi:serine/threonine protein kinase/sugar lactone lactonase YvrE